MNVLKLARNAAIAGALSVTGVYAANIILTATSAPGIQPTAVASAKGGAAKVSMPADFPTDVLIPAGTLLGTTGVSPNWSIGINIDGSYSFVMPTLRTFYVAQGFTDLSPDSIIPFGFENDKYTLQIVGRDRDHTGPQSTDVTIVVHKK